MALFGLAGIVMLVMAAGNLGSGKGGLENNSQNFAKYSAAELPDKCKVPPGYDEKSWKEHLGHHPDRYAECL